MKHTKNILLGAVLAIALICSLGFYDSDTFDDSTLQYFGSGRDVSLQFDGTNFELFSTATADMPFTIGGTTYGFDITYYFETSGTIAIDYDGDCMTFSDGMALNIGSTPATDGVLSWDNTNAEVDLTTATGSIHLTCSAVPDGQYGLEVQGAIAGATRSEGTAAYFHSTLTGNIDAPTYNIGSWLDITDGTPTASVLAAADFGIYSSSGAELSSAGHVTGLQIQMIIDDEDSPTSLYMMRFNSLLSGSGGTAPSHWFQAANQECIAYTANTTHTSAATDKIGAIKVSVVGLGDCYFYLYSHAGQ